MFILSVLIWTLNGNYMFSCFDIKSFSNSTKISEYCVQKTGLGYLHAYSFQGGLVIWVELFENFWG